MPAGGTQESGWLNSSRNSSLPDAWDLSDEGALPADGIWALRLLVSGVYSAVCGAGLLGNGLVLYLLQARQARPGPAIDVFVFSLALADFHFALTLPFWAVETALDFRWPFGPAMCKLVLTLTILSVYANAFLLTTMSIARYCSVASAIRPGHKLTPAAARWISACLWLAAAVATAPTTVFATVAEVAGERLCLLKFPSPRWLGLYHLQKVLLAFAGPLTAISVSYLLLLGFLRRHRVGARAHCGHRDRVAASVRLMVAAFFVCWFPNQAVTFWGALVKLRAVPWNSSFYVLHTYVFPLTTCLAHSSSCLNPVLYCLMRREFRRALKEVSGKLLAMPACLCCPQEEQPPVAVLLSPRDSPSGAVLGAEKGYTLMSTSTTALDPRARDNAQPGEAGMGAAE
ncbi:relaxin-3 receptor 2 [Alligator mississippiensis]|uniref:Relaxin-3 receptor 2 n=1 Tax=Alligator mississippiensis TaxID=8496 RepID=A0A151NYN6_ALLMI|nr:relaxin-3 receptor 2 [Alligator mississippiensis]KYO41770.1 relaxin-3 receptor 2 [Alligator mississippiensis]